MQVQGGTAPRMTTRWFHKKYTGMRRREARVPRALCTWSGCGWRCDCNEKSVCPYKSHTFDLGFSGLGLPLTLSSSNYTKSSTLIFGERLCLNTSNCQRLFSNCSIRLTGSEYYQYILRSSPLTHNSTTSHTNNDNGTSSNLTSLIVRHNHAHHS